MRNAKDYLRHDGPGKQTITSLAYWLTPEGLSDPLTAALLRKSIDRATDDEFREAFDGATKAEARKILATYQLCSMAYWGAEELAAAIHFADAGRDEKLALRAATLAQKIGELPDTFTPRQGVDWAMARGYLITGAIRQFVGADAGAYGHPHNPLLLDEPGPQSDSQPAALALHANRAESERVEPAVTRHKLSSRSHPLDAVIAIAEGMAADPNDYQSVWAALVKIAEAASRMAPLIGYTDGEGVMYRSEQAKDGVKLFTKKALAERYRRRCRPR